MTLKRKFEEKFSGAVSPYHIGYCFMFLQILSGRLLKKGFRLYHGKSFHKNQKVVSSMGKGGGILMRLRIVLPRH